MIEFTEGNLLEQDVQALVNTVNCVGVMGRGLALQFKNAYPDNFEFYREACRRREVIPGKVLTYKILNRLDYPQYIINFPTKQHWREKSEISYISEGLKDLVKVIEKYSIKSIAIPPLGCGLGGLNWEEIKEEITSRLGLLNTRILVFPPSSKTKVFFYPIWKSSKTYSCSKPCFMANNNLPEGIIRSDDKFY